MYQREIKALKATLKDLKNEWYIGKIKHHWNPKKCLLCKEFKIDCEGCPFYDVNNLTTCADFFLYIYSVLHISGTPLNIYFSDLPIPELAGVVKDMITYYELEERSIEKSMIKLLTR